MSRTEPLVNKSHSPSQTLKVPKSRIPTGFVVPLLLTCRHGHLGRGEGGAVSRGPAALRRGRVPPECRECEWHA